MALVEASGLAERFGVSATHLRLRLGEDREMEDSKIRRSTDDIGICRSNELILVYNRMCVNLVDQEFS